MCPLFASLCSQVLSEYLLLKRAYEDKQNGDTPLLAWRAWNLLELSVWSTYSGRSREKARRFYEDAGRDALGVYNAFTWGAATAQPADWLEPLESAKQDLSQRAVSDGIDPLDGPYKQVSEAAKECGLGDRFSISYRTLSKFAHSTAMQILASPDEGMDALQKRLVFNHDCLFFAGAFNALESQLLALGDYNYFRDYDPSIGRYITADPISAGEHA